MKGVRLMKIKQITKWLLVGILSSVIFLLTSTTLAGGYEKKNTSKFYIGLLAGFYYADMNYASTFQTNAPTIFAFNRDTFQRGSTYGAELGFRIPLSQTYFLDFGAGFFGNTDKAFITDDAFPDNVATSGNDLINQFQLRYNLDITAALGIFITDFASIYLKAGASGTELTQHLNVTGNQFIIGSVFQQTTRKDLWGFLIGLGLIRNVGQWFSLFGEFDYYDYGNQTLNTLHNIVGQPFGAPATTLYNQEVHHIRAYTFRAGINFDINL